MKTEDLSEILHQHPFLGDMGDSYIQTLLGCATNIHVPEGAYLIHEGQMANQFFLIRTGRLRLEMDVPPRGTVRIQTVGPGEVLGWSWLIQPYRWHFTALAVADVRALALDGECLRNKCAVDHDFGYEMLWRLSRVMERRLEATRLQLVDLVLINSGSDAMNAHMHVTEQPPVDPMTLHPVNIRRVIWETDDTFTLLLDLDQTNGGYSFKAGQFNMLYVFGVGEAAISISSDPAHPDVIAHTIHRVGTVTSALAHKKRGDVIGLRGPYGSSWPIDVAAKKDICIVAGGIGLAPLRPVVYELLRDRDAYGRIILLYGARSPLDLLYRVELEQWSNMYNIEILVTVDRGDSSWKGYIGVVTTLFSYIKLDARATIEYVCGPETMMKYTLDELERRGLPEQQVYLSMERNMKCAVGYCGHCQYGPDFICKDGPVF